LEPGPEPHLVSALASAPAPPNWCGSCSSGSATLGQEQLRKERKKNYVIKISSPRKRLRINGRSKFRKYVGPLFFLGLDEQKRTNYMFPGSKVEIFFANFSKRNFGYTVIPAKT
jgi:hypothetical protein